MGIFSFHTTFTPVQVSKCLKRMVRVGIVGYGALGRYLAKEVEAREGLELVWVWNRSPVPDLPPHLVLGDLGQCDKGDPDLIVEVAHPDVTKEFGAKFLEVADFMIGSPAALAEPNLEKMLRSAATKHALYVPTGALWGGEDIRRMAERGTLTGLEVTMRFPPSSLKLKGDLALKNAKVRDVPLELYRGPVRQLCPLAPNNVNTMAAASVAAQNLGFDGTVTVEGPVGPAGNKFSVNTVRRNPANPGAVTGSATYASFLSSLLRAGGRGPGVHLC